MNFDESFPKRIVVTRNSLGLTQAELAKMVGVVPRQIAAYEGGEARPRDKALINLAAALGTTSEWLSQGKGVGPSVGEIKRTTTVRELPVLTNIIAGAKTTDSALDFSSATDFISSPHGVSESAFALRINGHSMESGEGISFPDGSIVIFEPDIEPRDGDYVLCAIDDYDTTFKQFIFDQGKPALKPLNKAYSIIMCGGLSISIVGVAVHVQSFVYTRDKYDKTQKWNPISPWTDNDDGQSFGFEAEIESRVETIEKKLDQVLAILSNKKPT